MKNLLRFLAVTATTLIYSFNALAFDVQLATSNNSVFFAPGKSEMIKEILNIVKSESPEKGHALIDLVKYSTGIEMLGGEDDVSNMTIKTGELDFNELIKSGNYTKEGNYYYDSSDNTYFTYENGVLKSFDANNPIEYTKSNELAKLLEKTPHNSFFSVGATDLSEYVQQVPGLELESMLVSLSESGNTFTFDVYTKIKPNSVINYNDATFQPQIFEQVSTKNLLFFSEQKDAMKNLEALNPSFTAEYTHLTDLFNGKTAFFVNASNDNTLPSFSIATDIESAVTLEEAIEELSEFAGPNDSFDYSTTAFIYNTMYEGMQISISGQIINNHFVISSNPNIKEDFGTTNSTLSNKFSNTKKTLGIFYADPSKVSRLKWLANGDQDIEQIIDAVAQVSEINGYSKAISATEQETSISFTFNWRAALSTLRTFIEENLPTPGVTSTSTPVPHEVTPVVVDTAENGAFYDVKSSDWFYQDVHSLNAQGVVKSSTTYRPVDNITRAEFITMIIRQKGLEYYQPTTDSAEIFQDISVESWYKDYVSTAYELGLISGDSGKNTFRPNDPINRAEATKILDKALNQHPTSEEIFEMPFHDVSLNTWYRPSLQKCYSLGLVKGTTPNTFSPAKKLNRAEAAALVNRLSYIN